MPEDKPKLHIDPSWDVETSQEDEAPKLHVDSDWKAEAQREKERLAEKEAAGGDKKPVGMEALPDADFRGLLGFLAQQALSGLGVMQDPNTGRVMIDLEGSKYWIDMLGVVGEKTKGNLSDRGSERTLAA